MSAATDLQINAINNAANQIGNMAAYSGLVTEFANNLLARPTIRLPKFDVGGIINPGIVEVGTLDDFTGVYEDKGAIGETDDYQAVTSSTYAQMEPAAKQSIDSAIQAFVLAYCQPYQQSLNRLQAVLNEGLNDQAITWQVRQSWINELEQGLDRDRLAEADGVLKARSFGAEVMQPSMMAAFNRIGQAYNDRLAAARTTVFVKAFEMTLQYKQVCLQAMEQMTESLRNAFLQYATIQAGLLRHALDVAKEIGDKGLQTRETEIKGFEDRRAAALTLFKSLVEEWQTRMERFRVELQGRLDSRRMEYTNLEVQLKKAEIPYDGELRRNMQEAQLDVSALEHILSATVGLFDGFARVAQAAESGINSIGVATLAE